MVRAVLTAAFLLGVLVLAVLSGGNVPPGSGPRGSGPPGWSEDPENEETDFPVLWAAPGTIARTLPWELAPDRRPGTDITHLVECCPFSIGGRDFRITFADGSWCRLTSLEGEPLISLLTTARPLPAPPGP